MTDKKHEGERWRAYLKHGDTWVCVLPNDANPAEAAFVVVRIVGYTKRHRSQVTVCPYMIGPVTDGFTLARREVIDSSLASCTIDAVRAYTRAAITMLDESTFKNCVLDVQFPPGRRTITQPVLCEDGVMRMPVPPFLPPRPLLVSDFPMVDKTAALTELENALAGKI
jgi:hypothetical protein